MHESRKCCQGGQVLTSFFFFFFFFFDVGRNDPNMAISGQYLHSVSLPC